MSEHFVDYCWVDGVPIGVHPVEKPIKGFSYKIVSDPYKKRITIEKYHSESFFSVIYDSILLDFRQLRQLDPTAWQKVTIYESPQESKTLILSQEDRILFVETCRFKDLLCYECQIHSAHGLFLSTHRMYYKRSNDPFDGVILYDNQNHPVMFKSYKFDEEIQEFTELLEEQWNMLKHPLPIQTAS